jgi:UDP-galactopyranose mutase
VIRAILNHPAITVHLGRRFDPASLLGEGGKLSDNFTHLFYTGPLDAFFNHSEGRLGYRTVTFERVKTEAEDYQGNAVMNYPGEDVPWTRIHEHKHFTPWEKHEKTVAFREYSKETEAEDVPYYPKRLTGDKEILRTYRAKAADLSGISFLGRLATYRYMDMEAVIGEALEFANHFLSAKDANGNYPIFPNIEE